MAIPDYQSLMLPILRLTEDGQPYSLAQVREQIAKQLKLSDQELAERLASGSQTVFANRIAWAAQYLKHAGALESVRRSVYKITERGFSLLRDSPAEITVKVLRQFAEFKAFQGGGSTSAASSPAPTTEPKDTPEELLESSFELLQVALANDLLEAIRNGTPAFFEKTVVDLLVAMGYGGSVEDAGKVIGKSGDRGIDGVIKQDKLGLDALYVQAKRWEGTVGRPVVQGFSGSLDGAKARKGVLITTSQFSQDARDYARHIEKRIVLIDGKELAQLMIDYDLGVAKVVTYAVKRLDADYFDESG